MKTKKFYGVEIYDKTCNVVGHDSGIYGKGDYSWIIESLNGDGGEINMTKEEAEEVKADFEKVIKDRNLWWAGVNIIDVEVEVIESMQDIADYYNENEILGLDFEQVIKENGWVSDMDSEWGICHNDKEKVIINDNGEAVVMPL